MLTRVYLGSPVRVTLKERGVAIWKNYHNLKEATGRDILPEHRNSNEIKEGDTIEIPLWYLARIFGPDMDDCFANDLVLV